MEDGEDSGRQLALIPPSDGGVTVVTVAAGPPPPAPLTLALPIQQSSPYSRPTQPGAGGGGGGREDCWSESATSILIDAWGERYMELSRGNLKQAHWKEVADIVNSNVEHDWTPKTDIQCKNRIDTVKKKFKVEKSRVLSGFGQSRWLFFERMDRLIGPTGVNSGSAGKAVAVSVSSVSTGFNSNESVPVGIPFPRQPLPFSPQLMPPPHFHSPQPIRHHFPSPISQQPPRFIHHNHNSVSNVMLQQQQQHFLQQQQYRRPAPGPTPAPTPPPPPVETDSEKEGWSEGSGDSLPPETGYDRRNNVGGSGGVRKGKGKGTGIGKRKKARKVWGNSVRELTRAILKFGEAYETAESAKLEHIVEMEKQRMKFAKELELQRMKFFMKTQLELSQFNDGNENGDGSGSGNANGNSDSRGGGSR